MNQTGCKDCFENILGVLDFFEGTGEGQTGSGFSVVDGAILQPISHRLGLLRHFMDASINGGASKWAAFFMCYFVNHLSRDT
ncbi:MAG: hypothetical protein NVS2B7_36820 [Herpetosiphon sp.]